jgi:adenylate cyclase
MPNLQSPSEMPLVERELEITQAIDHVRDVAPAPDAMFAGILDVLADRFPVALCQLYLLDQETGNLELRAVNERGTGFRLDPNRLLALVRQSMRGENAVVLEGREVSPELSPDQHIAIIPLVLERPLGAVLLACDGCAFSPDELELLKTAESQMDSAVIQAYTYHELEQRNRELETIYRVDRIRDQNLPFDEMLDTALHELCAGVQADAGIVMLYNHAGKRLEMRAVAPQDFAHVPECEVLVRQAADEALETAEMVCRCADAGNPCMVMCVPLILRGEIIGVFGAVTHDPHGFNYDRRRLLHAIVSQMDTAIFEGLERNRLRRVLGRSLDPRVMERLLANPNVDILKGERLIVSVLYADLRGSTELAERLNPDVLVAFINDYLTQMTNVVLGHQGTLDKFVGDEVMALFGAPSAQSDHALRAIETGLAMQAAFAVLMQEWQARGVYVNGLGVGIATGDLIAGEFGCEQRADYTVIGRAANLGARICGAAHAGQVLISPATYDLVKDRVEAAPAPGQHFKGIEHEMTVYHVARVLQATR